MEMEDKDTKKSFSDLVLKKIPKGGNEENPKKIVNTLYEKDKTSINLENMHEFEEKILEEKTIIILAISAHWWDMFFFWILKEMRKVSPLNF